MKNSKLIRSLLLLFVCSLSFLSYRYLQNAQSNLLQSTPNNNIASTQRGQTETDTAEDKSEEYRYQPATLPDVELLKFVIQKSREGIPVLNFDRILPW